MSVRVRDEFGDFQTHSDGAGFRTDEDFNNLEVLDSQGKLIAAYQGGKWVSAVRDG